MSSFDLNTRARRRAHDMKERATELRICIRNVPGGGDVFDCGIDTVGGLEAGLEMARICMADLASISFHPGEVRGIPVPCIQVSTDNPVASCLASQYAGWSIKVDKYFAMGSGPMRAAYGGEELFADIGMTESTDHTVGILETGKLPGPDVFQYIADKTRVRTSEIILLTAPTASIAGSVQVVARVVETALHKLHELSFDLDRIVSGWGIAPLPPVANDDLEAIGRTNDCVLYGGRVVLWVRGDDASLEEIGVQVPSSASTDHGAPFLEIFKRHGHDFYAIDPHLFSPAEIVFLNIDSGSTLKFGSIVEDILLRLFSR